MKNTVKSFSVIMFVLVGMFWQACRHYPPGITPDPPIGNRPCDPDTVYFQNDILPMLISNCAMSGCHDAASHKEGVILTDYTKVIQTGDIKPGNPNDSKLYEAITDNNPDDVMPPPPNSPLSNSQIQLIEKWILQGARNLACDGECDTLNVTYTNTILPVIQSKCKGCHSGTNPSGSIDLSTYNGIKTIALNGSLYGSVTFSPAYSAMPKNGSKLPDCQIVAIDKWIKAGAPQN
ncbi:MAG: hypothetical protein K1X92_15480 [Bacteroidia bacterium]|nr:hypothetical protein [Bacteroidia bacterium]